MTRSHVGLIDFIKNIHTIVPVINRIETVTLAEASGRVTAEDIYSDIDLPPFNKAAMDGYAVAEKDCSEYHIIDSVQAGQSIDLVLSDNHACEIMTGAPVPSGTVRVIMYEHVERNGDMITVTIPSQSDNICLKGEDVKKGSRIVPANCLITPFVTGSLAAAGASLVVVKAKTGVTLAATGDELIPIDRLPEAGTIRDINSHTTYAALETLPFVDIHSGGIAGDTLDETVAVITRFIEGEDRIMLLTGGASKGRYDFVHEALEKTGCTVLVDSLRIKPGRPTIFATHGDKIIFGLPGNPVSVLIGIQLYIYEALYTTQGLHYSPVEFHATAGTTFNRKKTDRTDCIPVVLNGSKAGVIVGQVTYHGSAHINAFNQVNHIMFFPEGIKNIEQGEQVRIRRIW